MPSPLPRLIPVSQKKTTWIAIALLLAIAAALILVAYERSRPAFAAD